LIGRQDLVDCVQLAVFDVPVSVRLATHGSDAARMLGLGCPAPAELRPLDLGAILGTTTHTGRVWGDRPRQPRADV